MPHGGRRPGAGKPKGFKAAKTIEKEEMSAYLRARVAAELWPRVDAQIAQAKGLKYLVTRDKETGKFIRVGPALARAKREETIEVWKVVNGLPTQNGNGRASTEQTSLNSLRTAALSTR